MWYSEEETERGCRPPRPLLTVPITVLLYNDPLVCGFDVPVKGLNDEITINSRCSSIRHSIYH